jgi:hypothetical protein
MHTFFAPLYCIFDTPDRLKNIRFEARGHRICSIAERDRQFVMDGLRSEVLKGFVA